MWSRIVYTEISSVFKFRVFVCNFANESLTKENRKYVFKEVRNNSIIKDFAYGLISPQLLKIPNSAQSDTVVTNLIEQLNDVPISMTNSSFLAQIKKLGLFGAIIPCKYGGLGLSMTHYAYLIQHQCLIDWSLTLTAHQNLCAQTILEFGSEEQRNKYLPRMCSGEIIGAFCLTENSSGSDMMAMDTVGVLNAMEDHYVVRGTKNWVVNGLIADVMVVFVLTEDSKYEGGRQHLTALIVDRAMEGVSIGDEYNVSCLANSHLSDVILDSVYVPVANVLFEDNGGYKIANHIQNNARCMVAPCISGSLRILIDDLVHKYNNGAFKNDSHVQDLMNESVSYLYAIESGLYFTTRFADQYQVAEIELESAAVKVFSTETAKIIVNNYLRILSLIDCSLDPRMARLCDKVSYLQSFMGSNYFLRLYIGGTMTQLSEHTFIDMQERMKSPIDNFSFFSAMFKNVKRDIQWTDQATDSNYANVIDRSIFISELGPIYNKLQMSRLALFKALRRYAVATVDHQNVMEAMSQIGTLVYIVSCCVARANTNYGDYEMGCTKLMLDKAKEMVEQNVECISYVSRQGQLSLLFPLSEDIHEAGGYPSMNILELRKESDEKLIDGEIDENELERERCRVNR